MKTIIALVAMALTSYAFALTETVDGIVWHYVKSQSKAIIRPPNFNDISDGNNYTLLPAHEGKLPKVLTIPDKLGDLDVVRIRMGSIQLSDDSGVELIIVPATIEVIDSDSIIGEFVKSERISNGYDLSYKWFFKNASEHGLRGVLFLGSKNYVYDAYKGYIEIGSASHISDEVRVRFYPANDAYSSLWPQVYYIEGVVAPNNSEVTYYGVRYGAEKVEIAPLGGVFDGSVDVSLSCPNVSARIYYTLYGSEPTTNVNDRCFLYDNPITLSRSISCF